MNYYYDFGKYASSQHPGPFGHIVDHEMNPTAVRGRWLFT